MQFHALNGGRAADCSTYRSGRTVYRKSGRQKGILYCKICMQQSVGWTDYGRRFRKPQHDAAAACAKADAQCHPYPCVSSYDTGVDLLCPADALPWAVLSCGASGGACPLVLAVVEFRCRFPTRKIQPFFLVDLSESNAANLTQMEQYMSRQVKDMPKNNQYAIVTFGANAVVEQFLTSEKHSFQIFSAPEADATNLEEAVSTGLSMIPDNAAGRLVVLTDGKQTKGKHRAYGIGTDGKKRAAVFGSL